MNKIIQTPQQRANTLDALNVMWPSVPPDNVYRNLDAWRNGPPGNGRDLPTCRTVACFGGWCAHWPAFREQGVLPDVDGAPTMSGSPWACDAGGTLFGCDRMFVYRGLFPSDNDFRGSDHEIVTRRLQWLLANSEVRG